MNDFLFENSERLHFLVCRSLQNTNPDPRDWLADKKKLSMACMYVSDALDWNGYLSSMGQQTVNETNTSPQDSHKTKRSCSLVRLTNKGLFIY